MRPVGSRTGTLVTLGYSRSKAILSVPLRGGGRKPHKSQLRCPLSPRFFPVSNKTAEGIAGDSSTRCRVALGGIVALAPRRQTPWWDLGGFEELNRVAPYDRLLPFGERPTQFHQGDILQLPDPLSGHSELLTDFFESFRVAAGQSEIGGR